MTTELPEQKAQQHDLSWDEAVSRFLQENPDYFEKNPGLLHSLRIPHPDTGQAVSLIERQVQSLRDHNEIMQKRLQDLLEVARENDRIAARLHRILLALIDSRALDDLLDSVMDQIKQEFALDQVLFYFARESEDAKGRPEFRYTESQKLKSIIEICFSEGPDAPRVMCGQFLDQSARLLLFADEADHIQSYALIPLGPLPGYGVLVLGSAENDRFESGMGTAYLGRLGEVITASLMQYFR